MILPTKHLRTNRSLIGLGAVVLSLLDEPRTVSSVWAEIQAVCEETNLRLTFDHLSLALSMLFAVGAIGTEGKRLIRAGVVE